MGGVTPTPNPLGSVSPVTRVPFSVRPGAEASVLVEVRQLERYPVDLYYLVDVSASMQENLDQVGGAVTC